MTTYNIGKIHNYMEINNIDNQMLPCLISCDIGPPQERDSTFYQPTVLTGSNRDMDLFSEETF